ncbi:MAG: hypothetical protein E7260_08445 [Lachnospiraceae bacterium]|nr:hypothetical protein [Lachnospiraceae bacterium]
MMQKQTISFNPRIVLFFYLLSVSVLELLAYRHDGMFSILAARLWVLIGTVCLGMFCVSFFSRLKNDWKEKRFFLLAAYLFLLGFFCFFIGNLSFSDISYEAALQTAAGLSSFSEPGLNYTGVAFLNYANRQYVVNALPSLLFGRSITSLHLGYAIPFLVGMTAWFLELRQWLKASGLREEYALLPLYALPTFPFITEYFMNFEQTLTPISFTMMGLALLLRLYRQQDLPSILGLSFVGGMCCNSYTPVLAFFGYLVFFVAFFCLKLLQNPVSSDSAGKILLSFGLLIQLISYFIATLVTPQKSMISTVNKDTPFFRAVFESWFDFFSDMHVTFWGIWLGAVLLYLFFACVGILRLTDFFTAGWILLTVFFSNYMTGYTSYMKCHVIQRNMLIIPVFLTALFFLFMRWLSILPKDRLSKKTTRWIRKFLLPLTLSFFWLLGAFHFAQPHRSFLYQGYVQPIKYLFSYTKEVLKEQGIANTEEFHLVFLTDNRLQSNLSDYCLYFYPNAHAYVAGTKDFPELPDDSLPVFVFSESPVPPNTSLSVRNDKTGKNIRYKEEFPLFYME